MTEETGAAHPLEHDAYPVRASIETVAKGLLRPKFSFAYRTNEDMHERLAGDYERALTQLYYAASACGQQIEGAPTPPEMGI